MVACQNFFAQLLFPSSKPSSITTNLFLLSLAISLGSIIATNDDQILRSVVVSAREIALQDSLGTSCVSFLSIDGCSGHVRDHGIPATPWVLCSSEWVLLWCWLWEPDVTTVAVEVAAL